MMKVYLLLFFVKILDGLDYDLLKDSISKRTKSIKNDPERRVDKVLNPPLGLPDNGKDELDSESQGLKVYYPL